MTLSQTRTESNREGGYLFPSSHSPLLVSGPKDPSELVPRTLLDQSYAPDFASTRPIYILIYVC